eukprot:Nk52_evm12s219 gene=Nk52_evmTU12s219
MWAFLLIAFILWGVNPGAVQEAEAVVSLPIGSIWPSGPATTDISIKNFVTLTAAVNHYNNASNGLVVDGVTLTYAPIDSLQKLHGRIAQTGVFHMGNMIQSSPSGVMVVLGCWNSRVTIAANNVASSYGVPQISIASTSPKLSRKSEFPTFVRMLNTDNFNFRIQAELVNHYGWKKVAIINSDDEFAANAATAFRSFCTSTLGVTISAHVVVPPRTRDHLTPAELRREIQLVKDADSTVILAVLAVDDFVYLYDNALVPLKMRCSDGYVLMGGNAWPSPLALIGNDLSGTPRAEGLIGAFGIVPYQNTSTEIAKVFEKEYEIAAKQLNYTSVVLNTTYDPFQFGAWDAVMLVLHALKVTVPRLNELGIPLDCLISKRYLGRDTPQNQSPPECLLPLDEVRRLQTSAKEKNYTGVTAMLNSVKADEADEFGIVARYPTLMLLHDMYAQDFMGLKGRNVLTSEGNMEDEQVVINVQYRNASKGVHENGGKNVGNRAVSFEFVNVATWKPSATSTPIGQFKFDAFPGSTVQHAGTLPGKSPVTEAPNDTLSGNDADDSSSEELFGNTTLFLIVVIIVAVGVVAIVSITWYLWQISRRKDEEAELRIASCMWLIDSDELQSIEGGCYGSIASASASTSAKSSMSALSDALNFVNEEGNYNEALMKIILANPTSSKSGSKVKEIYHGDVGRYQGTVVSVKTVNTEFAFDSLEIFQELSNRRDNIHANINGFIGVCPKEQRTMSHIKNGLVRSGSAAKALNDDQKSEQKQHMGNITEDLEMELHLLTTYCQKGSLDDIWCNATGIELSEMFCFSLSRDLIAGLQYLHCHKFLKHHGNLKPSNCLVDNRWTVKLTDFGLTTLTEEVHAMTALSFSSHSYYRGLKWSAPEAIKSKLIIRDIFRSTVNQRQSMVGQSGSLEDYAEAASSRRIITENISKIAFGESSVGYAQNRKGSLPQVGKRRNTLLTNPFHRKQGNRSQDRHKIYNALYGKNVTKTTHYGASDIYGFGLICAQLFTGEEPFLDFVETECMEYSKLVELIADGQITYEVPKSRAEITASASKATIGTLKAKSGIRQDHFDVAPALKGLPDMVKRILDLCTSSEVTERPSIANLAQLFDLSDPNRQSGSPSLAETMSRKLEEYSKNLEDIVRERTNELSNETAKVRGLLEELMPPSVAASLLSGAPVVPEEFECVTLMFVDIVSFTPLCAALTPIMVIGMLNDLYTRFDASMRFRDVYKVETIGDAYFVASGIPIRNGNRHAVEIAILALNFMSVVVDFEIPFKVDRKASTASGVSKEKDEFVKRHPILSHKLQLRGGIHAGTVVAGIVGARAPKYAIFGDTVNTASRMESSSLALRIQISHKVACLLDLNESQLNDAEQIDSDPSVGLLGSIENGQTVVTASNFTLEKRGVVQVKGKGDMTTWWLCSHRDIPLDRLPLRNEAVVLIVIIPVGKHQSDSGKSLPVLLFSELSMYHKVLSTATSAPRTRRRVLLALLLLCVVFSVGLYSVTSAGLSSASVMLFEHNRNGNLQLGGVAAIDGRIKEIATEVFGELSSRHGALSSGSGCEESLKDSNGIFCLPDEMWRRVRKIARRQRLVNMYATKNFKFEDAYVYYQTAWEAEISCPEEMRVGLAGEGGKWLCDPDRLLGGAQMKCLVYSVGSNNEYGFEESIHRLYPHCEIHTFDHTVANPTPPGFVRYHKWGVSHTDGAMDANGQLADGGVYRLPTIIKSLGHEGRTIAVLKIDVEGAEYKTFEEYFVEPTPEKPNVPQFNFEQILIEIHSGDRFGFTWEEAYRATHELMVKFVRFGKYAVSHKEPNIASPFKCCSEFVFIKMAPSFIGDEYLTADPSTVLNEHQPPFSGY